MLQPVGRHDVEPGVTRETPPFAWRVRKRGRCLWRRARRMYGDR